MDEAPLLVITNYEVTYFLLRDVEDVTNKVLKVSPPVPWNSQDPLQWPAGSTRSSWQLSCGMVGSRTGFAVMTSLSPLMQAKVDVC